MISNPTTTALSVVSPLSIAAEAKDLLININLPFYIYILGLSVLFGASFATAPAPSGMDLLYDDHVPVLSSGEPVITIGIGTGWQVARLRADAPLNLSFYEGDQLKQVTVKAGHEVEVRVRHAIPAQREALVDFEAAPLGTLAAKVDVWRSRGVTDVTGRDEGVKLDMAGRVYDNRVQHVVAAMANLSEAKALATRMNGQYGAKATVSERLSERPSGELSIVADGMVLGMAVDYVQFTSDVPVEVLDVEYGAGYAWHGFENRKYWGEVYAVIDPDGAVAVANAVGAETVLQGVVPAEIFSSAAPEALKVQAVAARSTLLAKLGHCHLDRPYHLCSEQHCQVYAGASRENTRSTAAVQATRGQALFLGGHLVDALYSSTCGGHTEDNDAAWGKAPDPALRGRPDFDEHTPALLQPFAQGLNADNMARFVDTLAPAFCARVPQARPEKYRWRRTFGSDDLDTILSRNGVDVGALRDIVVRQRGRGGRVIELQLVGSERTTVLMRELPIRQFFGNLNSAAFVLDVQHDAQGRLAQVAFNGGGWGHGVGMCQLGAMGRAAAGQTCAQILEYYYNGATLSHMYR